MVSRPGKVSRGYIYCQLFYLLEATKFPGKTVNFFSVSPIILLLNHLLLDPRGQGTVIVTAKKIEVRLYVNRKKKISLNSINSN